MLSFSEDVEKAEIALQSWKVPRELVSAVAGGRGHPLSPLCEATLKAAEASA